MEKKAETNEFLLEQNIKNSEIRAYRRRWIILAIFMFYAGISSFQWIEYSIITNIVMRYYDVSAVAVDWTAMLYMALYAPLIIPGSYIIDKKGLRTAALIGGLGTAFGTIIKVLSIRRDLFYVVLIGQGILSISQVLILCLPPRIAAVWFKPNEVSTACSLGVFGTQLGCALGYVFSPLVVHNHENPEDIGPDLRMLCWGLAFMVIPGALAVIFYFPHQPPKPPSITQVEERSNKDEYTLQGFFSSIKALCTNKAFIIHVIAYGINLGVFCALGTLLNQFVLPYFPNGEEDAGRMGLVMISVGMVGSICCGVVLDKWHKYKIDSITYRNRISAITALRETTLFIYFMSGASIVAFMFALELKSKLLVYIAISFVGFFTNAYMPAGFEIAMELTFPSPESTTTGLLMAPSQILGVIFTLIIGQVNATIGTFWALLLQAGLLFLGTVVTGFIPNLLRRQDAFQAHKAKLIEMRPMQIIKN